MHASLHNNITFSYIAQRMPSDFKTYKDSLLRYMSVTNQPDITEIVTKKCTSKCHLRQCICASLSVGWVLYASELMHGSSNDLHTIIPLQRNDLCTSVNTPSTASIL